MNDIVSSAKVFHSFRSRVMSLLVHNERLLALTEKGVYILDKNGKRWRKVNPKYTDGLKFG